VAFGDKEGELEEGDGGVEEDSTAEGWSSTPVSGSPLLVSCNEAMLKHNSSVYPRDKIREHSLTAQKKWGDSWRAGVELKLWAHRPLICGGFSNAFSSVTRCLARLSMPVAILAPSATGAIGWYLSGSGTAVHAPRRLGSLHPGWTTLVHDGYNYPLKILSARSPGRSSRRAIRKGLCNYLLVRRGYF